MVDAPTLKPKRRFAPQLVETSVKSSSKRAQAETDSLEATAVDNDGPTTESPKTTAKRRFALQLVEESVTKSSSNKKSPATEASLATNRTTKDASVQVDDIEMSDAPSPQPRRRFAPVPIETTFDSYRVQKNPIGPTAELTPDPSPTSTIGPVLQLTEPAADKQPTEKTKIKRRFAPQLIETSRRARRAGQEGPATRPTDKTDITPGTNHIYAPRHKRKLRANNTSVSTNEDDHVSGFLLTRHRQQSFTPHPNTRRTTGTNPFHPELDPIVSSGSDKEDDGDDQAVDDEILGDDVPSLLSRHNSDGESWVSRNYETRDRRESCDEDSSVYLLAVAAREAQRQKELEQAMSAFPNGLRIEGVEHFFVRDSSEDDHGEEEEVTRHGVSKLLIRRKSTDPGWAVKQMRQHAEKLAQERAAKEKGSRMSIDDAFDQIEVAPPPEDPLWTTNGPRPESPVSHFRDRKERKDSGHLAPRSKRTSSRGRSHSPRVAITPVRQFSPPAGRGLIPAIGGFGAGPIPTIGGFGSGPIPAIGGFGSGPIPAIGGYGSRPWGNPFTAYNGDLEAREYRRKKKAASPPMLGADLKFRLCPSPKTTRMEPDHPYPLPGEPSRPEEQNRDTTMETGLWRGYCVAQANEDSAPVGLRQPALLATPAEPISPVDPFASAFSHSMTISGRTSPLSCVSPTKRHSQHKGLHLLSGLDDRLKREKARKDIEERIAAEFDDAFVTQVYNYISLGYPATARAFDEELSKISGIRVEELQKNDSKKVDKGFMLDIEIKVSGTSSSSGSDSCGNSDGMRTPEEDERRHTVKPPRWKALRLYIREWARQHPNLNDDRNPLAWGVPARRGSWAI